MKIEYRRIQKFGDMYAEAISEKSAGKKMDRFYPNLDFTYTITDILEQIYAQMRKRV